MFTLDQKVFDYFYGCGKIVKIDSSGDILVHFNNHDGSGLWYTKEGFMTDDVYVLNPTLATKEYKLDGFTQEPQINWEDYIGKWCIFKDSINDEGLYLHKLKSVNEFGFFYDHGDNCWSVCEPLSEEQVKILNLE